MIHNPYTYASGDAENLRKVAAVLDQATEVIIAAYKSKSPNIDEVELRRLVNAETWLQSRSCDARAAGRYGPPRRATSIKVRRCLNSIVVIPFWNG